MREVRAVMVTRRLVARGRVQGVWFRESMRREAEAAGAAGWVRNRPDGTVEAVVHGPPDVVERLVAWAHQGPPLARVEDVQVAEDDGEYSFFEIRPTG
jgi:acylphosphatase